MSLANLDSKQRYLTVLVVSLLVISNSYYDIQNITCILLYSGFLVFSKMNSIRCMVCWQIVPTMKKLKSHCIRAHSKLQLVKALLKNSVCRNPLGVRETTIRSKTTTPRKDFGFAGVSPRYLKTETLYLEDDFQNSIFEEINANENYDSRKDEYVEGNKDECSSLIVDKLHSNSLTEFSFVDDNKETFFEEYYIPLNSSSNIENNSPLNSDSDDKATIHLQKAEENIRKHKEKISMLRNFRFNKVLKKHAKSLNEKTGKFYICHCMEEEISNEIIEVYRKCDLQNLNSDTDSCSDSGKNYFIPITDTKFYCNTCGNGYKTKQKLINHFKKHVTKCNICNQDIRCHELYKQHIKRHLLKLFVCHLCEAEFGHKRMLLDHLDAHIEDDVYENIFGLEQDYKSQFNQNIVYYTDYVYLTQFCP